MAYLIFGLVVGWCFGFAMGQSRFWDAIKDVSVGELIDRMRGGK